MDKNKLLNLVGTGTAVGALLLIATLFSNGGLGNWTSATSAAENDPAPIVQVDESADLETQNAQLQEALVVMQEREAEYQAKINEANDMLMNPEPVAAAYGEGEEMEEEEMDDDEIDEEEEMDEDEMEEEDDDDDDEIDDDEGEEGGILGLDLGFGFGEKDD